MRIFGFDRDAVDRALAGVGGAGGDAVERDDRFARVVWTVLAEPGDGIAGVLVAELGAAKALGAVLACLDDGMLRVDQHELTALAGGEQRWFDALKRWRPRADTGKVVAAFRSAAHVRARLLTPGDAGWPEPVDDLGVNGPLLLWCRGTVSPGDAVRRAIALVGARAATSYGEYVTTEAAAGLADRGFTIVSGAAYGIDGAAHRAALASTGPTVAFLAGGVDRFYPAGHDELLHRIAAAGVVVSEVACGTAPTSWRFLQRNRLIAAASSATVVVEAGYRSGSINTAGHAGSLGRPLGAVPGPVTSPSSAGCHRLLRDYDAVCVTSADEMAQLVEGPRGVGDSEGRGLELVETRVIDAMSTRAARDVADIAARSGLSVDGVASVLGLLELEGAVRESSSGWRVVPGGR